MTVDCDVHQGNGTAAIFGGDHTVFTLSIHQENNYPYPKPPSSLDINLADGVGDEEYLRELAQGLDRALAEFKPDLIFYVAGADPYRDDQLGGLKLSLEGLEKRDRLVFEKASEPGTYPSRSPWRAATPGDSRTRFKSTPTPSAWPKSLRSSLRWCRVTLNCSQQWAASFQPQRGDLTKPRPRKV